MIYGLLLVLHYVCKIQSHKHTVVDIVIQIYVAIMVLLEYVHLHVMTEFA